MKRAVFLDRDGTINVEKDYLFQPKDFEFISGAEEAIALLNHSDFMVIVVSNQSGVARGYYTEEDVYRLHNYVDKLLAEKGAKVNAWLYCPHHPEGRGSYALPCRCRKPQTGMFMEAARKFDVDLDNSIMIGDKFIDVKAGSRAGCRSILVRTGYGAEEELEFELSDRYEVYDNLLAAVKAIVGDL